MNTQQVQKTSTFDLISNQYFKNYSQFSDAERTALIQFSAAISFRCRDAVAATDYAQGIHTALLLANRDLYAMLLIRCNDLSDIDRQIAVYLLLTAQPLATETRYLDDEAIKKVIFYLLEGIRQPRNVLRPFEMLVDKGINRSSIQRFVLRYWLNHPALMSYSTNFGSILSKILVHTWGKRNASTLAAIIKKTSLFDYEENSYMNNY